MVIKLVFQARGGETLVNRIDKYEYALIIMIRYICDHACARQTTRSAEKLSAPIDVFSQTNRDYHMELLNRSAKRQYLS